ncbi:MAG: hypothetical protein AAF433_16750 [Bacteroidota bacterium]
MEIITYQQADPNSWPISLNKSYPKKPLRGIQSFLGPNFSNYVKVYHAAYLDLTASSPHLSHAERENLSSKEEPPVFSKLFTGSILSLVGIPEDLAAAKGKYQRILWREIFESQGLEFKKTSNPEVLRKSFKDSLPSNLYGFCGYGFDIIESQKLADALWQHGYRFVNCFYDYLSSGLLLDRSMEDSEIQFELEVKRIPELIDYELPGDVYFYSTPNYLWDENRSFLIWSDYDLAYSFIGCNDYFLRVIQDAKLEYQLVDKACRYDYRAYDKE